MLLAATAIHVKLSPNTVNISNNSIHKSLITPSPAAKYLSFKCSRRFSQKEARGGKAVLCYLLICRDQAQVFVNKWVNTFTICKVFYLSGKAGDPEARSHKVVRSLGSSCDPFPLPSCTDITLLRVTLQDKSTFTSIANHCLMLNVKYHLSKLLNN